MIIPPLNIETNKNHNFALKAVSYRTAFVLRTLTHKQSIFIMDTVYKWSLVKATGWKAIHANHKSMVFTYERMEITKTCHMSARFVRLVWARERLYVLILLILPLPARPLSIVNEYISRARLHSYFLWYARTFIAVPFHLAPYFS